MVTAPLRARDWAFLVPFGVYTAAALGLLVLGLAAGLAVSPEIGQTFQRWAQAGGVAGAIWETTARAARLSLPPPLIVLDYLLSLLNIGCGLFLIWRRPHDWVARLLAIAMIGTAMSFNYQTHSFLAIAAGNTQAGGVPAARPLNLLHFFFHAVSGAAYVHALILFPDGRAVPRGLKWVPPVLYGIALEELARIIYGRIVAGPEADNPTPGLILATYRALFDARPLRNFDGVVNAEVTFFVFVFGLLIPVLGIISQVRRYRGAGSPTERAQSHLMLWALTFAFSVGLLYIGLDAFRSAVFAPESATNLYGIMLRISPVLLAVLPIAIIVAIARYRLFDLTIAIDRTIVYWPLTAVLAILFLGTLFLVQQVFRALIGEPSELAVAAAAFVNIFLFQPLRKQVQGFIDHRFFGIEEPRERDDEIEAQAPGVAPP